jgi:hypothetical protein
MSTLFENKKIDTCNIMIFSFIFQFQISTAKDDNWAGCPAGRPGPTGFGPGLGRLFDGILKLGPARIDPNTIRAKSGCPLGARRAGAARVVVGVLVLGQASSLIFFPSNLLET